MGEQKKQLTVTETPEAFAIQGFTHCVKDRDTGNIEALFADSQDAYTFLTEKTATPEDRVSRANSIVAADYQKDVSDTADSIRSELNDQIADGEYGESLREWLIEHIHETIDGAGRVMYTAQAMECVRYSNNDGAYFEEFGTDGAVTNGTINWSALAFAAFQADVQEDLTGDGVDLNAPVPACDECGTDDQDQRRWKVEAGWQCDDCKEAADEDDEPDIDHDLEAKDDED